MDANQDSGNEARRIIAVRWPSVVDALDAVDSASAALPDLQLDKSGPVATLYAGDIRLASAWDPLKEAELQCSVVNPGAKHITLFGVGMGYLPPLLLERLPVDGVLTVVPMNLALLDRLLALIDMTSWLGSSRVQLRLAETYDGLPVNTVTTPPTLQLAETTAAPVRDWLLQKLSENHVQNYQQSNQKKIEENIAYHLEHHLQDEDIATLISPSRSGTNTGNGVEAGLDIHDASACDHVVIGAGPSLDYSAAAVMELQKNGACTIAVDAALVSLLAKGIIPDFVVCLDPLDYVERLFEVDQSRLSATSLVYFPTANHTAVAAWSHKRYSAIGSHSRFEKFNREKPSTVLFSSGSVIHPAVDLAVRKGAENVYLAGADFGFPFELTHAVDSPFAADRKSVYADGRTVLNYHDEEMPSQINFISYFRDLEQYIDRQVSAGVKFYNLGHYSAKIRHVTCIPLAA